MRLDEARGASGKIVFARKGAEFIERINLRDYNKGALQLLILGAKGAGKTTLMAHFAYAALELGDIVLWRGRGRDFWPRFEPELVKVFVHKHDELRVWRLRAGSSEREDITDRYTILKYESIDDLMNQFEPGFIHVVYEPKWTRISDDLRALANVGDKLWPGRLWWFDMFFKLARRIDARWISLFIDEFDDIVPAGASGEFWRLIEAVQHALAEFRDRYISLFASTHDPGHIDSRILKKMSGLIYLKGAIIPRKISKMRYKTLTLDEGHGVIEILGEGYGGFTFDDIPRDAYVYAVEKHWTGPEPKQEERRRRWGVTAELLELARREGVDQALEELEGIRREGWISRSHYYRLKRALRELSFVDDDEEVTACLRS